MSKVETYVKNIIAIADDNSHGYSQLNRWGLDYDCSSLVITVVQNSGIPVKSCGATYTGNMYNAFIRCGFTDVSSKINFASGSGLKRGDVLLNPSHHTEIYIGNGKLCGAHSNYDGKTGDSSGREINYKAYYNYPWKYCLRYTKDEKESNTSSNSDNNTNNTNNTANNSTYKTSVSASDYADYFDKSLAGKYITTANLNMRNNGTTKAKVLVTLPKNTVVRCYGYYDRTTVKWLYVEAIYNNVKYTGFCSNTYLTKI